MFIELEAKEGSNSMGLGHIGGDLRNGRHNSMALAFVWNVQQRGERWRGRVGQDAECDQ